MRNFETVYFIVVQCSPSYCIEGSIGHGTLYIDIKNMQFLYFSGLDVLPVSLLLPRKLKDAVWNCVCCSACMFFIAREYQRTMAGLKDELATDTVPTYLQ
jgi:hypothetical protein